MKTGGFKKVLSDGGGINIFEKKLVFIPIHGDNHWSLCVVVNPGATLKEEYSAHEPEDLVSCLIFLNSMQPPDTYNEGWIAVDICSWLNGVWTEMMKTRESQNEEWKDRIDKWKKRKKKEKQKVPFHQSSLPSFFPKGTHM